MCGGCVIMKEIEKNVVSHAGEGCIKVSITITNPNQKLEERLYELYEILVTFAASDLATIHDLIAMGNPVEALEFAKIFSERLEVAQKIFNEKTDEIIKEVSKM